MGKDAAEFTDGQHRQRSFAGAALAEKGNLKRSMAALDRALELFDLSIACNRGAKLREICHAREELCDYFYGGNSFGTDPVKMQKYYDDFILLGR